jgi:hypothetical protein
MARRKACAVVVMEVLFALKTKVQEVRLSKAEDVVGVGPERDLNRHHRVKPRDSQFQYAPQVVISVVRFVTDRGERSIDLRGEGARNQAREQFHKCPAHQLVAPDAKGRDTQTFEPVREHDGVKWHNGDDEASS